MKVFVRTSQMTEKNPQVIATYPSESPVAADAHGEDVAMLEIPEVPLILSAMPPPSPNEPMPSDPQPLTRLPDGWRQNLSDAILQAEAKRRIDDVLPPAEQIATLHETLDTILRHGLDASKWPADAKKRKAEIESAWAYVRAVRERAGQLTSLPSNPSSDKNWPPRKK